MTAEAKRAAYTRDQARLAARVAAEYARALAPHAHLARVSNAARAAVGSSDYQSASALAPLVQTQLRTLLPHLDLDWAADSEMQCTAGLDAPPFGHAPRLGARD